MANIVRRGGGQGLQRGGVEWEPFRLVRDLLGWDPFAEMTPFVGREGLQQFAPQFEIKETNDGYIFKADLPGVKEEDVDVSLTGNRLTICGKREAEEKKEEETYYAYERQYGSFTRSFTLPEGIDDQNVVAELKNGVLTIALHKKPELQPKKIQLKTGGGTTSEKKVKA